MINYMLRVYSHNFQELATIANISVRTLRKIRNGDVTVEKTLCLNVYYVLAEYHNYSNYKIKSDLAICDAELLKDRKEY